jgi:pimeloyl-ACP methyl ester carboxylesterase
MVAVAMPSRVSSIVSIAGLSAKGASADPARQIFMAQAGETIEGRIALARAGLANRYSDAAVEVVARRTFDAISGEAFKSYARDSSRTDISGQVGSLQVPVLVLVGERDPNATEASAKQTTLTFYGNAKLSVIGGAGHYPMTEAPIQTISALEAFVAGEAKAS